jgi:hypothetical protein
MGWVVYPGKGRWGGCIARKRRASWAIRDAWQCMTSALFTLGRIRLVQAARGQRAENGAL